MGIIVKVPCSHCGKLHHRHPNRMATAHHFCSRDCYVASGQLRKPRNSLELRCATCGKSFSKPKSQLHNKRKLYCSNSCRYESRRGGRWTPYNHVDSKTVLSDLFTLSIQLGYEPNTRDVNKAWSGRSVLIARRFGSLANALRLAGVTVPKRPMQKAARSQRRVTPTSKKSVRKKPTPSHSYPANKGKTKYTNEELLAELQRVAALIGHTPTDAEFRKYGNCSTSPFWKQFGKWANACELAGLVPHSTAEGGTHRVPSYYYKRRDGKKVRLVGSYEYRFAKVLDRLRLDWLSHGDYSPLPYKGADGRSHRYHPDFYIPAWDLYIETKGWYQEKDKIKMQYVARDNPRVTVIVIGKDALAQFERTKRLPLL